MADFLSGEIAQFNNPLIMDDSTFRCVYSMVEIPQDINEIAQTLIENAENPTVTYQRLATTDTEEGIILTSGLNDVPPIAYLDEDEQPHFIFTNSNKGVGIGTKDELIEPDSMGICVNLFTDKRVLIILANEPKDTVFSIPYEQIFNASYNSGILKHRIILNSADHPRIHLWINGGNFESEDVEHAVEFINDTQKSKKTIQNKYRFPSLNNESSSLHFERGDSNKSKTTPQQGDPVYICRSCQEDVDKDAKKCPNCGRNQQYHQVMGVFWSLLAIPLALSIIGIPLAWVFYKMGKKHANKFEEGLVKRLR